MRFLRTVRPRIAAYSDGSCYLGDGGWGVYVSLLGNVPPIELWGGERNTTIGCMELRAAIEAVRVLPDREDCLLFSDSQYVVTGLNEHIDMWLRTNWRTSANKPLKNLELWQELYMRARAKRIEFRWVKGHSRVPGNERADALAMRGRLSLNE